MDIRGVGKPIPYSDDNPVGQWIETLRKGRQANVREPRDQAERELLGRWMAYRGRFELDHIVGSACYAYSHFEIDDEWKMILADHIRTEAGHGWGYIKQGDYIDPSRDHTKPDPEFPEEHGLLPRVEHAALIRRDFLSYLMAGNLWPYGHTTAVTIGSIMVTTPRTIEFEERVVQAEEQGHHDAALQKLHDYVWGLIDYYGEEPIRRRIAEIDAASLNARSRTIFDPPQREFLKKHFDTTYDNLTKFHEWREYLYLNVLGFPPEPVHIKTWPREVPQPTPVAV
jgi:hypothetical protein